MKREAMENSTIVLANEPNSFSFSRLSNMLVKGNLREDILAVVDGEPYTWKASYLEVKDNTEKPPALIAGMGRALQKIPIGVIAKFTANQIYREEISQRRGDICVSRENR